MKWRQDRRCGKDYPLPNGTPAQCNPDGPLGPNQAGPCCSASGYCGGSPAHCECDNWPIGHSKRNGAHCIDFRKGRTFENVICTKKKL